MSGQRAPSSSPMPPQPFRFWLPYRSNVGSWRHQPRPPSSPQLQPPPPPPPPPTPAEPSRSRARAVEEDIPVEAEPSDESDTIPVQSSDSSQLRGGGRPSMADLELTLSGSLPTGQEQRSGGRDVNPGNNDTKIAISGFPRSRLFDSARAPFRQEIADGLKSLAGRATPAPRPTENGQQGYHVVTLAGHNVGATMVVGPKEAHSPPPSAAVPEDPAGKPPAAVAANVNSNVQSVNNSSMEGSTCSAGNPGVHVDIMNGREEPLPAAAARTPSRDEKRKEMKRRPPLVVPARPRRCLRALMMETNGSDTEAARKPRPSACRFQCVADHAPQATATSDGAVGESAEDGGKASAAEAN